MGPVPVSEVRCARRSSAGRCGSEGTGCRAVSGGASMGMGGRGSLLLPRLITGMSGGRAVEGEMWAESVDDAGGLCWGGVTLSERVLSASASLTAAFTASSPAGELV